MIFASKAHDGMFRKGSNIPYIVHPMEAGAIAASVTDDEEVIAAAILHDVLEDTSICEEEIENEFGKEVLRLVKSDSEDKREELPPEQTWKIRKQETIDYLRNKADSFIETLAAYEEYCELVNKIFG